MNQGDCRQYPDDINLDRLPRFELKVIEIFILFSLVNIWKLKNSNTYKNDMILN